MDTTVAPALRALLDGFIDYAGLFPPAALPLDKTVTNYRHYQNGQYAWMLRWLVVPVSSLTDLPADLDGALSVISEADDNRAAALETKTLIAASRPVYYEVPDANPALLDQVKAKGCFAKIRTGGLKAEAIPTPAQVAAFILACADCKLAFKATAGLHHPIRAMRALTYEKDAPQAVMHGFLNVLMAAALAWHGERDIEPVLAETDGTAFLFDDYAHWRNKSLSVAQIKEARIKFIHSVGSCSFDEPVNELQELALLPETQMVKQ